jgi:hypothetical protein
MPKPHPAYGDWCQVLGHPMKASKRAEGSKIDGSGGGAEIVFPQPDLRVYSILRI